MNNTSEQINEIMAALAKAQGQIKGAAKDSTNPHFKSKYADLASVWEACRDALSSNALAVTQTIQSWPEGQMLVTILGHSSGQWIRSTMLLPIQKPGPQELGSCLSYCRRYSLASIVGIYQSDDDGEAATQSFRASQPITEQQCAELDVFLDEFPESVKALCEKFNIKNVYDLPQNQFGYVMSTFRAKQKKKAENG